MKQWLNVLFLPLLFVASSCKDDESKLENKWQLRQIQQVGGQVQQVDSVFYNFQKGSFSAICLLQDSSYLTFFGNYSLLDDKISIILLPDYEMEQVEEYLKWREGEQIFRIEELSSSVLRLSNEEISLIFRKY